MNKFFTKIAGLSLGLAMAIGVGVAVGSKEAKVVKADSATITYADQGWSNGSTHADYTISNFRFLKSGSGNAPAYYTSDSTLRYYNGNTLTISSTNGSTITAVSSNPSQTFTVSSGQATISFSSTVKFKSITITYSGGASSHDLTYAVGTQGTYDGSTTKTFSVAEGAKHTVKSPADVGITAKSGYIFTTWSDGTSTYNPESEYTMGNADVILTAQWAQSINVTYVSGDHSSSSNHVVAVASGSTHELISYAESGFVADSGWVFKAWSVNSVERAPGYNVTVNAAITVTAVYSESTDYTLVTDASALVAGTTFVLAHESTNTIGIGAWSSSYFTTTTISISGTTISTSTSAMVFTLEGSAGAWNIKSGDYYYGLQNSTTALRATTASGNNYSWTITISNGIATMKTAGSGTRSLCYNYNNGNTPRYSAYTASSTYTQVRIFAVIPSSGFSVTYNSNGATSGSVPTDGTSYSSGDTVTVLGNTGTLAKTGFTWNGWNTSDDGSGTHYNASGTFEISGNVTLYAEWVKSLDAITAISGNVTAALSKAGTYDWDFSGLTVTGTLSGSTGQNVNSYVDLSSSTAIPSSIGSCTVSVTATKKSTVPGSASSLTVNNISGEVEAPKLVYTFTMTQADLLQTNISYVNENGHEKSSTATCADHDSIEIAWASNQIMKNSSDMQFQTTNGYLYNTTEIPGTITSVEVTATAQSFTVYYGNAEHPTSGTTPGGKFFTVQGVGSTPKASQIVVTFEVSDKPKVQLVASDINNLDVADGAAIPTVTDGTSAVTGYSLVSEDTCVASITNDGKVQPVGYGRAKINVTKEEDAGHIYLATSFMVYVKDHSKEDSVMEFTAKAEGSATADDGVVWTIDSGSITENDFSEVYGINYGTNGAKINSLTFTTPADEERIIKNVVVEAMSATSGSTITVSVGGSSFVCSKDNSLTGNVSTFNFSGNKSGAITITMSGTASSKYGVKSISVLYVGDEATSFASTFLGAVACNASGTSKPTFNFKPDGVTPWTWALLADEFNDLSASDKAKFAVGATGVSSAVSECVARYDYIVGKYFKTGIDTSFTDFMSRNPSPIGNSKIMLATVAKNSSTTIAIIAISAVSLAAVGGYFLFRKKKED